MKGLKPSDANNQPILLVAVIMNVLFLRFSTTSPVISLVSYGSFQSADGKLTSSVLQSHRAGGDIIGSSGETVSHLVGVCPSITVYGRGAGKVPFRFWVHCLYYF